MLNNSRIKTAIDLARLAEIELEDAMKEYMDRRSAAFIRIITRVDCMLKFFCFHFVPFPLLFHF